MTTTPVGILMEAARMGLKLGIRPGDKLTFEPAELCPQDFLETLREHKAQLLELLRRNDFVLVDSKAVGALLFFCQDDQTRAALVEAGAAEWIIYTKEELRILCEQNRVSPISAAELQKIHLLKRTFSGRITE
jgi:replication fork clamp-binding protein CrfC